MVKSASILKYVILILNLYKKLLHLFKVIAFSGRATSVEDAFQLFRIFEIAVFGKNIRLK